MSSRCPRRGGEVDGGCGQEGGGGEGTEPGGALHAGYLPQLASGVTWPTTSRSPQHLAMTSSPYLPNAVFWPSGSHASGGRITRVTPRSASAFTSSSAPEP